MLRIYSKKMNKNISKILLSFDKYKYNNFIDMYINPVCSLTSAPAVYFCHTQKCTLPAFCCEEACLTEHAHNKKQFMLWDAISATVNNLASNKIPEETLRILESHEKKIKIMIEELNQIGQRNTQKITECQQQLILTGKLDKLVSAMKRKRTCTITGDDMANIIKNLKEGKNLFKNQTQIRGLIQSCNMSTSSMIQKSGGLIEEFKKKLTETSGSLAKLKADHKFQNFHKSQFQKAITLYKAALIANPEDHDSYYKIAACYQELQLFKQSLENINKAIEINDKIADYYALRAEMLYYRFQVNRGQKVKETEKGLDDCDKTLKLNPKNPWISCLKTLLEILLERRKQDTIFYLKKDLDNKILADHHKIYYYLGDFFEDEMKDLKEAEVLYEKALKKRETSYYYSRLFVVYYKQRKVDEALRVLGQALVFDPDEVDFYQKRAMLNKNLHRNQQQTLKDYANIIDLDPDYIKNYMDRIAFYLSIGKQSQIEKDIKSIEDLLANGGFHHSKFYQLCGKHLSNQFNPPKDPKERKKYIRAYAEQLVYKPRIPSLY